LSVVPVQVIAWRTVSEMTCNVSSGTLNLTHSLMKLWFIVMHVLSLQLLWMASYRWWQEAAILHVLSLVTRPEFEQWRWAQQLRLVLSV